MQDETKKPIDSENHPGETNAPDDQGRNGQDQPQTKSHAKSEDISVDSLDEAMVKAMRAMESENAEIKERMLRLAADMENLRRRTARDVKDARTYAVTNFARDMLSVSDNLRRAIDAVPADARESGDKGLTTLIEGVEMTERSMLSALQNHGVKKIEPKGERFDPNFHQAMFEVPDTTIANNTVVEVVQTGYVIGDRVLRPAMVGVSKGGPKAERSEATPASQHDNDSQVEEAEPGPPNEQATRDA